MGSALGYALLLGFGGMKITQLYKEIARRLGLNPVAWWKSTVNLAICLLLALLIPHTAVRIQVFIGLAAAGIGATVHALDTVLRAHRDDLVAQIMTKMRTRNR